MRMMKTFAAVSFAALTATAAVAQDGDVELPTLPEAGAPVTNLAFLAPAIGVLGIVALSSGGSSSSTSTVSTAD